jgi:hypothetical protein
MPSVQKFYINPECCHIIIKFVLTDISDEDVVKLHSVSFNVNILLSFVQVSVNISFRDKKLLKVIMCFLHTSFTHYSDIP